MLNFIAAKASHAYYLYKNFSMLVVNVDLGTAPITASFFSPLLNIMTVGNLRMPYRVAIEGLSSVLTLTVGKSIVALQQ